MPPRHRLRVALLAAALLAAACGDGRVAGPTVPRNGRFELAFSVPDVTVHPDDVAIRATITTPSGEEVAVDGFRAGDRWRVRFSPWELGEHRFVVAADPGGGERTIAGGAFVAVEGAGPGRVRPDADDPRRLEYEDGTPFFVLGENRINIYDPSWNWAGMVTRDYVAYMAANGMTTLRVFVFADCEAEDRPGGAQLGCLEPRVGRFDETAARAFDEIFAAAEEHGIQVILTVWAIGFSVGEGETWKSWEDNPHARARGGAADQPTDFFDSPAVREQAKRKLRYVLARWGYSPSLLAVDLLNEPEWDGQIPEGTWIPWAEEMAAEWRARDPYGHLITVGPVGLSWNADDEADDSDWYQSPQNDVVQWHLYGKEYYAVHALADEMARRVAQSWEHDKPVLCGEFGWGGDDPKGHDHTHVGLWTAIFSGGGALAHSAPQFTLDCDQLMTPERAAHFRVLRAFLDRLPAGAGHEPRGDVRASIAGMRVFSLRGRGGAWRAVWALAPAVRYGERVAGATLVLPEVAAGVWRITWIDDVTGATLAAEEVRSRGGELTVAVPPFARHLAGLLEPRP